jgi:hypothetical protein
MDAKIQEIFKKRQEANLEILNKLGMVVRKYHDLRFGQILVNLGIIEYERNTYDETLITKDPFNEESVVTLNRMKNII